MTKTKLTPQQERELELVAAEMALSGYQMDMDALRRIGERYYGSDEPEAIRRLVEKARREGRTDLDFFIEHFPLAPPKEVFD